MSQIKTPMRTSLLTTCSVGGNVEFLLDLLAVFPLSPVVCHLRYTTLSPSVFVCLSTSVFQITSFLIGPCTCQGSTRWSSDYAALVRKLHRQFNVPLAIWREKTLVRPQQATDGDLALPRSNPNLVIL